jgi:hypothetical protein
MKKNLKKLLSVMLCMVMLLILVPSVDSSVQAASAKLNKTKATMTVGGQLTLKVTGTTKKATWSSSNSTVASVSGGTVKAKKAGTATITAKVGKKRYKCVITVNNSASLYKSFLTSNQKTIKWYYVLDIDKNGVADLVASDGGGAMTNYVVYTIKSGKVVKTGECTTRGENSYSPNFYYVAKYHALMTSGWTNFIGGSWANLFVLSGSKLKVKYHAREQHNPNDIYYTGTNDTSAKKVSKSSYNSYCKKYFKNYKTIKLLSNSASNRLKSFG